MAVYSSTAWLDHVLFIHSSVGEHLGCSHLLAVENYAALDAHVQCVGISFITSGCLPKSRLAGSVVILCLT